MGDPVARVSLGEHDVVRPNALQDPAVLGRDGLGPDLRGLGVHEVSSDEHAGLEGGPDPDDGDGEVLDPELSQCLRVGGVRLDERDAARPVLDEVGGALDREHVLAEPV